MLGALALLALATVAGTSGARSVAHAAGQCSSTDTGPQNPANPLDTAGFSGTDPLAGAHLFVESPWQYGGDAANAIANEVGRGSLTHQQSGTPIPWADFETQVNAMHLSPAVSYRVQMLEKIGQFPQAHQFSLYTAGGSGPTSSPRCRTTCAGCSAPIRRAAAVITTYFIKHGGGCNGGTNPNFDAEVSALKDAVGNFPALIFVEEDAIDTICWRSRAAIAQREALLKDEIDQLSQLPHALLYVEGGTSDANSPAEAARVLNAADASKIRGFFTNDTHFNWAYKEIQYGNKVSALTHGLHFVVDTRGDGNGPLKNPHPVTQGNEHLCNPPGRALGPMPGASDGTSYGMYSPHLDGFVWVTTPGESTAPTCAGDSRHYAASGIFDENIAVGFASRANNRIGPSPRFKSAHW